MSCDAAPAQEYRTIGTQDGWTKTGSGNL